MPHLSDTYGRTVTCTGTVRRGGSKTQGWTDVAVFGAGVHRDGRGNGSAPTTPQTLTKLVSGLSVCLFFIRPHLRRRVGRSGGGIHVRPVLGTPVRGAVLSVLSVSRTTHVGGEHRRVNILPQSGVV